MRKKKKKIKGVGGMKIFIVFYTTLVRRKKKKASSICVSYTHSIERKILGSLSPILSHRSSIPFAYELVCHYIMHAIWWRNSNFASVADTCPRRFHMRATGWQSTQFKLVEARMRESILKSPFILEQFFHIRSTGQTTAYVLLIVTSYYRTWFSR